MRILLLVERLPYPELDGYGLRFAHHLKRLAARHEVDVLTYDVGELVPELELALGQVERVRTVEPPRQGLVRRAADAFTERGLHHRYPAFAEAVRRRASRGRYDVAWVGGWRMAQYMDELGGVPAVLDATDDEVLAAKRALANARGPLERAQRYRDVLVHARYQKHHFRSASVCLFVTETDAASTRARMPGLRCEVLSNGVDTDHFACDAGFSPLAPSAAPTIVFEGSMSFAPNVEAAIHLVRDVLPLVRAAVPGTRAMIVGRHPTPEVRALAGDGVEVTGSVDDVRPYLAAATVSVSPMLSGAGIKNKILQAWSMGRPVVATTVSTGGLNARSGRELLIADGAEGVAQACVDVIRSPELAAELGRAGREAVVSRYSWLDCTARLERWLEAGRDAKVGARAAHAPREREA